MKYWYTWKILKIMLKATFAVVYTDKICGRSLSKIPVDIVILVVFRLMKNIIFNKTESFVRRNTSNHAFKIFCSKSNCETMYHWFSLLEITVLKIMNNLNVCSAHSYLYPRFKYPDKMHTCHHFLEVSIQQFLILDMMQCTVANVTSDQDYKMITMCERNCWHTHT